MAETRWGGEALERNVALGKEGWSRISPMQKQPSHPQMAPGFPRHSVSLSVGKPTALGKHSLPDLPAGPSVLVPEYYSLHLLSIKAEFYGHN